MTEGQKLKKPGDPDAEGLRKEDSEYPIERDDPDAFDPDEELEPGVPLRPTGLRTDAVDPDLRADDESQPDVLRVHSSMGGGGRKK